MSEQQFCLKWNNFHTNLSEVFHNMLQSESMVDVTIACEGASLKAHKMILAACSPFFQSLFMSNPCKHPIVILKDVRFVDLKATIDFVYKGEINVTQSQLGSVLKAAETLKIKGLTEVVKRQREINAAEIPSVHSPKKRKRKQKTKNLEPSSLPSCDESSGENDAISVMMEGRSVSVRAIPIERPIRESGGGGEINPNQVIQSDSSSIPIQTILPTTEVTAIENESDDIIVATDSNNLHENHPTLQQITYEEVTQNQVLPVVTIAGTTDLSQLILGKEKSMKKVCPNCFSQIFIDLNLN